MSIQQVIHIALSIPFYHSTRHKLTLSRFDNENCGKLVIS